MQSHYPSPHQMAAAAAAAAGGINRLSYSSSHPGAPDSSFGRASLIRDMNSSGEPAGESDATKQDKDAKHVNEDELSEIESDIVSENDEDDVSNINGDVLDSACQEVLSRLKQPDHKVRSEEKITKHPDELRAYNFSQRSDSHDDITAASQKDDEAEAALERSETPAQTEIKMQRPLGLLAQHGLTIKSGLSKTHSQCGSSSLLPGADWLHDHCVRRHEQEADKEDLGRLENGKQLNGAVWKSESDTCEIKEPEKERLNELNFGSHLLLTDQRFMPSPPPSTSPLSPDHNKPISSTSGHHWTFEEQFKQLYEMSLEPKRKEFLDDLFLFMQKRGTPVNRIPIMAKQTLDLYELFRLVVSKGGLVEVINKKLWREITKGLNLPLSITSAAFTLRTQYMKYLYPYECERLKLSTLAELQSAIDGNRREGRRPGYGYDFSPIPAMLSTSPGSHLSVPLHPLNSGRPSPKDEELPLLMSSHNHLRSLAEHDVRAMEAASRAMEEVSKRIDASRVGVASSIMTSVGSLNGVINASTKFDETPPCKRPAVFDDERLFAHMGMHSTHIKMTNQSHGRLEYDSPMVVNMEINGMMYHGVLFAQHPRRI